MVSVLGVPMFLPCFWENAFCTISPACPAGTYWKAASGDFILIVISCEPVALMDLTLA